jgi:chromosome segregation ATPase
MNQWSDLPPEGQEVSDLQTARLALRGALEAVRSLQDSNATLKGDVQELRNKNKFLDQRILDLQTELASANAKLEQGRLLSQKREAELRGQVAGGTGIFRTIRSGMARRP